MSNAIMTAKSQQFDTLPCGRNALDLDRMFQRVARNHLRCVEHRAAALATAYQPIRCQMPATGCVQTPVGPYISRHWFGTPSGEAKHACSPRYNRENRKGKENVPLPDNLVDESRYQVPSLSSSSAFALFSPADSWQLLTVWK